MEQLLNQSSASCSYAHIGERSMCRSQLLRAGPPAERQILQTRSTSRLLNGPFRQARPQKGLLIARAEGAWNPPTVADTKRKFYDGYKKPISGVYNTVIQELLVQQHIMRYNKNYVYDEVFALGFVSVFDQVLDGISESSDAIFKAYVEALDEDPGKYRADADRLAEWGKGLSSAADIKPDPEGDDVQKLLANIAESAKGNKFLYTKFFAIGLFRLLELTGAKEPQALGNLIKSMNVPQESVNRDLMTYKGVLSKLSAAKELMQEFMEREKRKQAEREAEKKAQAESKSDSPKPAVAADTEKANA